MASRASVAGMVRNAEIVNAGNSGRAMAMKK
jgi:hypothetical protein